MTRYIKLPSLTVPPDKPPLLPKTEDADRTEHKTDEAEKPSPGHRRKARIL